MKYYYYGSANYIELEEDEQIIQEPIELGDKLLVPGDFINKIGEKKRSNFEMQDGYYLKYLGYVKDIASLELLFGTNVISAENRRLYYSFSYIDKNTLLMQGSKTGFWDIKVQILEVYKDIQMIYMPRKSKRKFTGPTQEAQLKFI